MRRSPLLAILAAALVAVTAPAAVQAQGSAAYDGTMPLNGKRAAAFMAGRWALAAPAPFAGFPTALTCQAPATIEDIGAGTVRISAPGRAATKHELATTHVTILFHKEAIAGTWKSADSWQLAPRDPKNGFPDAARAVMLTRCR